MVSVKVTDKLYYTLSDCMGNGLPLMRNELTKQFALIGTDGTNAFEIRKSIVCIFSLIILLSLIVLCLGVKTLECTHRNVFLSENVIAQSYFE
jgi:hypothetical protein